MINSIKNNEQLIEYVIKLGFESAECIFPHMTLYTKDNGNYYEIYFIFANNVEDVLLKKFIPLENQWALTNRYSGLENAIKNLNKEFKFELRNIKLKKMLNG